MELTNAQTGALFTIPIFSWQSLAQITSLGSQQAPGPIPDPHLVVTLDYPALYQACRDYNEQIVNAIMQQAVSVASYASTAISSFGSLNNMINSLPPNEPIPVDVQNLTAGFLTLLGNSTSNLVPNLQQISSQISNLVEAYTDNYNQYNQNNGQPVPGNPFFQYCFFLQEMFGQTAFNFGTFTVPLQEMTGAINAISSDIAAYISQKVPVTYPFLESLNLEACIVEWQSLQKKASMFTLNSIAEEVLE